MSRTLRRNAYDHPVPADAVGAPRRNRPLHQSGMRAHNLAVVLRHVRDHGPCSRAQIAVRTGLTKPAVGTLVDELVTRRLLRSGGTAPSGGGRPGSLLRLDGGAVGCVGAEINVGMVRVSVRDLADTEVHAASSELPDGCPADDCIAVLGDLLSQALTATESGGRTVVGIAIAVPALVDAARTRIVNAPGLGWKDVPLGDRLAELLRRPDLPIDVDNIANFSAVAESSASYPQAHSLVHLEVATGIGAGLVVGQRLQRGFAGFSGAIGHAPLRSDGPRCACGRIGCFEALAGTRALLRAAGLLPATGSGGTEEHLHSQLQRLISAPGVPRRHAQAYAQVGEWIGRGAATLINLLDPEVLILGGYVPDLATRLMPSIEAAIDAHVIAPDRGGTRVTVAALGARAALTGAARSVAERVFDDPTRIR